MATPGQGALAATVGRRNVVGRSFHPTPFMPHTRSFIRRRPQGTRTLMLIMAAVMLLVGTCYVRLTGMMTHVVHTYKPAEAVARGNHDELARRFAGFPDPAAMISLEWNTYDNPVVNRPPYKLYISVQTRVPDLRRVMVDEVRIRSSRGRTYTFSDTLRWPLAIDIDPREEYAGMRLEPAFPFGHGEGEEITTRIRLRMVTSTGEERPVVLETRWVPVRVKRWVPIV